MSATIENQVVSMQFDNKHFESNVKTTLSTLDKLKQSLKFPGAAKSFDDISASAKKVNLNPIGSAAEKVGLKFNAMYTMADQAFRNIVTRAQYAAENVVKSFTIEPIKTGFQEYETQIGSVQTILANTQSKGSTLADVNGALDELNSYADKTIYNFTEMTRNIGTFTAAGVELDKSVQSIKGIANLAAISGSTSQQASTAMYQLSQALAAGKVQLMDWNSVVNAGMGGEVFQTALKRTAKQMGHNVDELIEKYGSFRESLTQGEWLTAEVLTETLAQLSGAYSEADLIAQGYSESQAKEIAKLAKTAESAATDVKTFTQLMDTLKESAQSGWTQTWEYLVGDFEEAKEFWSGLSETIGGFIGKSAERRNNLIGGALTSNWDKLVDKINKAGVETVDFEEATKKALKDNGYNADELITKYGSLEKVFRSGAASSDVLKDALDGLKKSGKGLGEIDFSTITRTLKTGIDGDDVKKVEKALLDLGYNLTGKDGKFYGDDGHFGTLTRDVIKEFQKEHKLKITGEVDAETLAAIEKAHEKMSKLNDETVKTDESFDELINGITELGGREKLIKAFGYIFAGLRNIISPLGKAFNEVFKPLTPEKLVGMINKFQRFAKFFKSWNKTIPGQKFIQGITNAFKGFLSVIKLIATVAGGLAKGAFTILGKIFNTVGVDVVTLIGNMGKGITKFQEWITSGDNLSKVFSVVSNAITGTIDKVRGWVKAFFELPAVQENLKKFKMEFSGIVEIVKSRFGDTTKRVKDFIGRIKEMDGFTLGNIKSAFVDFFNNVLGPIWKNKDGTTIFDGLVNSLKNLWTNAKKYCSNIGNALSNFGDAVSTFFSSLKKWARDNAGGLFALGALVTIFFTFKKIADGIEAIAGPFGQFGELAENLGDGIKRISKAASFNLKAEGVKAIATSIAILAGSIVALTLVDTDKLWPAVGALIAVVVALGSLIVVLNKFGGNLKDIAKLAGSILMLSGALFVFAMAAKTIAGVDGGNLLKTGLVLAGFIGLVKLLTVVTKGSAIDISSFGKMMLGLSGALLIMSFAVGILGNMKTETLIKGGAAVGAFLIGMALMMKATKSLQTDIPKFATMMVGLSAALLLMSVAVGILGNMDAGTLIKGGITIASFLGMMVGMMAATKLLAKDMPKFGSTMLGLSFGLLAMALTVKIIAGIDTGDLIKGGLVIAAFLGMMVGMMAATKLLTKHSANASKIGLMMLSFAGAMILLTGAIAILATIDGGDIAKAVAAIAGVGLIFAGMVALTKFAKVGKGVKTTIITMAAAVGVLAISIAALSFVDSSKLMGASAALSIVMGMFALMSYTAKAIGIGGIASILVLTGIVAVLGYIIKELADIPADGALKVAGALSALILSLSASCLMLGAIGLVGPAAFIGVGVLAALLAVIGLFAGIAIASLPKIGEQLSEFMDNLSGFLDGAERITPEVGDGIKNLADAIMTLTSAGVMNALMLGSPIGTLAAQLKPLGEGLKGFADSVNDCDIDSSNVDAAVEVATGLAELAGILPNTEGLWGWLSGKEDIGGFGTKLKDLGDGLASFAESIAGEKFGTDNMDAAVTVASSLADLAAVLPNTEGLWGWLSGKEDISSFGAKLKDLGEGLSSFAESISWQDFDADNVDSAVDIATSLADLAAVLPNTEGLWGWLSGKEDIASFGTKLGDLGSGLASFAESISGQEFNTDNVDSAVTVASSLADLAAVLPNTEGLWGWLSGKEDIASFGTKLGDFGISLASFAQSISGQKFNTENMSSAVDIATSLADLAAVLPNTEGLWGWLSGKEDIGGFGTKLKDLGSGLASFAESISGQEFNTDNVDSAVTVASSLADLAAVLPNTEGLWGWLSGKEDIASFGTKLGDLGSGLASFSEAVDSKTFNSGAVTSAVDIATSLADLAAVLPNTEGLWGWLSGKEDIAGFGTKLSSLGEGLAAFSSAVSTETFNPDSVSTAVEAAKGLGELATVVGESSAGWDWLTGKDGLDTFGTKVSAFGTSLSEFCAAVSGENFSVDAVNTAVGAVNKFADLAEQLGGKGIGDIKAFGEKIKSLGGSLKTFSDKIKNLDATKFSAIATGLSDLASINITNADTIQSFVNSLGEVGTEGVDKFASSFKDSTPKVIAAVNAMLTMAQMTILVKGMLIKLAVTKLVSNAAEASHSAAAVSKFMSAGYSMAEGFARGISSGTFLAVARASAMASLALAAAKAVLKINSPSKVFIPVGEAVPEGFAMGIDNLSGVVKRSTASMADNAIKGASSAISRIADIVNMDIETQPTIRPVLDLSEVESGIGGINSMFGMQPSVGVMANVRSINSMMASRQNGVNNDVISAIKDLGGKLGNTSGDTYNVNGITYDDGSNVTNAVKALIRGVRVGRRI